MSLRLARFDLSYGSAVDMKVIASAEKGEVDDGQYAAFLRMARVRVGFAPLPGRCWIELPEHKWLQQAPDVPCFVQALSSCSELVDSMRC